MQWGYQVFREVGAQSRGGFAKNLEDGTNRVQTRPIRVADDHHVIRMERNQSH
jgi:hypothetical protein